MGTNPNFTVRFYVRTTKTQGGDSPTPLRVKVWVSDTKSYLYFSTKVTTTKRIWADFSTDGSPSAGADPALVKVVDAYKAATQLVISAAIANDRIKELTSEQLSLRIDAVVAYIQKQQQDKSHHPLLVFTTPLNVPTCEDCKFRATTCKASWKNEDETDIAPDLALYQRVCLKRELNEDADPRLKFFDGIFNNAKIIQNLMPSTNDTQALALAFQDLVHYYKESKKGKQKDSGNGNKE